MRGRGRPRHPDILTPREWEVLALLREHRTNEEIARALGISFTTARFHVSEILAKLGVSSREEAARWQPPERRAWLLAPIAILRRLGGLGAPARIAAGATLAIAAVGVALLAWGVFATGGNTDAGTAAGALSGTPGTTSIACGTPPAHVTPGLELGTAPIFWRFALTEQDLTSGHYCGRSFKVVLRDANGFTCNVGQTPGPIVQAGNVATDQHLSIPTTCAAPIGADLPGTYFTASFELPSAGEWRLQVEAGSDFSTQTVRIGGADVPTLAGGPQPPCAPPQQTVGATLVVIVDRAAGQCHVVPTADRLMQAKWVEDGKTFVAYDTDEKAFVIYDIDGNPLQAIHLKAGVGGSVGGTVSPSPDGRSILVERDAPGLDQPLVIRDVATGQDIDFPKSDGTNGQASYSPDGAHAAYVNTSAGKQSLVIATVPLTDGRYTIVKSVDTKTAYITPLAWARDGKYLLVMTGQQPCVGSAAPSCVQTESFDVVAAGTTVIAPAIWSSGDLLSGATGRLTFGGWADASHVLLRQPAMPASGGPALASSATLVSIPDGTRTTVDPRYADLDSISPDGRAAIEGNKLVQLPSFHETPVVAYDAMYMADWTADSAQVLLSFGGK